MNIPHYSVPADPGSARASLSARSILGLAMPLILAIVSAAVWVGDKRHAEEIRVVTPEPAAPTAEEIDRMVNILADKKVKKVLEELWEGSCLRKG